MGGTPAPQSPPRLPVSLCRVHSPCPRTLSWKLTGRNHSLSCQETGSRVKSVLSAHFSVCASAGGSGVLPSQRPSHTLAPAPDLHPDHSPGESEKGRQTPVSPGRSRSGQLGGRQVMTTSGTWPRCGTGHICISPSPVTASPRVGTRRTGTGWGAWRVGELCLPWMRPIHQLRSMEECLLSAWLGYGSLLRLPPPRVALW